MSRRSQYLGHLKLLKELKLSPTVQSLQLVLQRHVAITTTNYRAVEQEPSAWFLISLAPLFVWLICVNSSFYWNA